MRNRNWGQSPQSGFLGEGGAQAFRFCHFFARFFGRFRGLNFKKNEIRSFVKKSKMSKIVVVFGQI